MGGALQLAPPPQICIETGFGYSFGHYPTFGWAQAVLGGEGGYMNPALSHMCMKFCHRETKFRGGGGCGNGGNTPTIFAFKNIDPTNLINTSLDSDCAVQSLLGCDDF